MKPFWRNITQLLMVLTVVSMVTKAIPIQQHSAAKGCYVDGKIFADGMTISLKCFDSLFGCVKRYCLDGVIKSLYIENPPGFSNYYPKGYWGGK